MPIAPATPASAPSTTASVDHTGCSISSATVVTIVATTKPMKLASSADIRREASPPRKSDAP